MSVEKERELERMLACEQRRTRAEALSEDIRTNMTAFIDCGFSEEKAFQIAMALLIRGGYR